MELRLPGGSGFLDDLLDGSGRPRVERDNADFVVDPNPSEVAGVLGQLFEGCIEYVGLNGDVAWIQTADAGRGYILERNLGDDVVQFPSVLTAEQVQAAFLAFHAGDVHCGLDWAAAPVVAEPKPKRGWFTR